MDLSSLFGGSHDRGAHLDRRHIPCRVVPRPLALEHDIDKLSEVGSRPLGLIAKTDIVAPFVVIDPQASRGEEHVAALATDDHLTWVAVSRERWAGFAAP